jgi:D-amino peptidase
MKILIAVDMEGISGVVNWDQVNPTHAEYSRFRKLMTEDVNAAIRGAFEGGATQVTVTDGHAYGYNLLIEQLDSRARLNSGNSSPFSMIQGIDEGIDGVFFVGYHARAGSGHAILDHTWSSKRIIDVTINGRGVGEVGLNGAVAGHFNIPVLLVTGDQTVCGEAKELLGMIEFAVVKQATGRMSAECLPPRLAQEKICEAAVRAVTRLKAGNAPAPLRFDPPVTVLVEFVSSDMADQAELLPGSRRLDGRRIEFTAADMVSAYRSFRSAVALAQP